MTIETRKPAINNTKVTPLNWGEWTHFNVQGSNDGVYHSYIPPMPHTGKKEGHTYFEYHTSCHCKTDPYHFPPCKGNSNGTVCHHVLAAIKYRVAQKDKVLSLPKDGEFRSAVKLTNLGGQLIKVTNQNGKAKWGVVR